MPRTWRTIALAGLLLAALAPSASAHQGNPNYRSHILEVSPDVPGVTLSVGDFNADLILTNHSHRTITVLGYDKEPYARILADGTAQVNKHSPAYYLNQDYYGQESVPKSASPKATPQWVTQYKTGQYEWHDHRIHWMSRSLPPQVKDKAKTTKIFNWTVPIRVGAQPAAIKGDLFWKGSKNSFPLWALISGILIVGLGIPVALMVHRRRLRALEAPREAW